MTFIFGSCIPELLSLVEFPNCPRHITAIEIFDHAGFVTLSFYRVNCYDVLHSQAPFGGFKMSGSGREL